MCVILQFTDKLPKGEMLQDAQTHNSDGGGIAWIKDDKVVWEKGMHVTAEYIKELIKKENIKMPFIVHFRIATHGAVDTPLCHPFAITDGIDDLASNGEDPNGVLFHNGVWGDYKEYIMNLVMKRADVLIPDGDLSDSRVMAWLVKYLGMNYLTMIDEKVTILTPKGIKTFGSGWTTVNDISCSNDNFDVSNYTYGGFGGRFNLSQNYTVKKSKTVAKQIKKKDFRNKVKAPKNTKELEEQLKREIKLTKEDLQTMETIHNTDMKGEIVGDIETKKKLVEQETLIDSTLFVAKTNRILTALDIEKSVWLSLMTQRFGDIYNDVACGRHFINWIEWLSNTDTDDELYQVINMYGTEFDRSLLPETEIWNDQYGF